MGWYNIFNKNGAFTDGDIDELIIHCKKYNVDINKDMLNDLITIKEERLRKNKIIKIKSKYGLGN